MLITFFFPHKIFPHYCCFLYTLHLQSSLVNSSNEFRSLDGIIMVPCTLPRCSPTTINLHRWIKPHRAVLMPGKAVHVPSGRTRSLKGTAFLGPRSRNVRAYLVPAQRLQEVSDLLSMHCADSLHMFSKPDLQGCAWLPAHRPNIARAEMSGKLNASTKRSVVLHVRAKSTQYFQKVSGQLMV